MGHFCYFLLMLEVRWWQRFKSEFNSLKKERAMANNSKKSPSSKSKRRKSAPKKTAAKRASVTAKSSLKSVGKSVRGAVKSAGKRASVARKAGRGLVRRAVKALGQVAAPLMPGGTSGDKSSN